MMVYLNEELLKVDIELCSLEIVAMQLVYQLKLVKVCESTELKWVEISNMKIQGTSELRSYQLQNTFKMHSYCISEV